MEDAQPRRGRGMAAAKALCSLGWLGRTASRVVPVVVGAALASAAQQVGGPSHSPPPLPLRADLHRAEVVQIHSPGPAAVVSNIKCGPSGGNIYATYSTSSRETSPEPIRRISPSSGSVTEYPVPTILGYDKLLRLSFDVSSDGALYALLRATPQPKPESKSGSGGKPEPVYLIVKYKDDGSTDSQSVVDKVPGNDSYPKSLAVFADGRSLVSGTTLEKTTEQKSLGVFSGIFDRGGAYRSPVTLMKLAGPPQPSGSPGLTGAPTAKVRDTASEGGDSADAITLASSLLSVSSSDGNIYVLKKTGHLDVVSALGAVEHEFELKPPAKGLSPLQMAAAGDGFLFVFYDHLSTGEPEENAQYRSMITVIDPRTGEVTAIYNMPQAQTDFSVPACASSPSDFVFLGMNDQGYLEVVHYTPN